MFYTFLLEKNFGNLLFLKIKFFEEDSNHRKVSFINNDHMYIKSSFTTSFTIYAHIIIKTMGYAG